MDRPVPYLVREIICIFSLSKSYIYIQISCKIFQVDRAQVRARLRLLHPCSRPGRCLTLLPSAPWRSCRPRSSSRCWALKWFPFNIEWIKLVSGLSMSLHSAKPYMPAATTMAIVLAVWAIFAASSLLRSIDVELFHKQLIKKTRLKAPWFNHIVSSSA